MSQIADITVFDGATTPVSHTLKAMSVTREGGKITAYWRENLATVPVDAQMSLTLTIEKLKSGVYRTERTVMVPYMESIAGSNTSGYTAAPKVARMDKDVRVQYTTGRADINGRRLLRQLCNNLDGAITTSVVAVSSGAVPELFDQLISPT
ncbi:coat protein [ssRNA phage SRR5466725_14]|uniref:Coat protein n=1 Tax=ssRNA phage SRR5466725_14 TaxID=2786412 RepID=A0A8S5L042_9VIRU|nr:coat protein [ssRNA phage SRR5466725_14]DAD50820.1 TPA_asm: coat protein [ssRNA phage SRR5466725_14]